MKTKEKVQEIVDDLPGNKSVANDILQLVNNSKTIVKLDDDIKNSYYVYLNDTIYLSNNKKSKEKYGRICLIAHECIHSIQNKLLQKINFILSNLELLTFITSVVLMFLKIQSKNVLVGYAIICIISAIPRLILEIDAVVKSSSLAKKYLDIEIDATKSSFVTNFYKKQTFSLLPLFVIYLFFGKIVRYAILLVMAIIF